MLNTAIADTSTFTLNQTVTVLSLKQFPLSKADRASQDTFSYETCKYISLFLTYLTKYELHMKFFFLLLLSALIYSLLCSRKNVLKQSVVYTSHRLFHSRFLILIVGAYHHTFCINHKTSFPHKQHNVYIPVSGQ